MRKILAISAAAGLAVATVPAVAYAATGAGTCVTVHDTITKTDNGHGTPAEWANLVMRRTTKVCGDEKTGYTITLVDKGSLWTRPGAGTPNGTGGQITRRVKGTVNGTYDLTAMGALKSPHPHGDVTASATDYVKSLFTSDSTVTGGKYAWKYATKCEPDGWLDSSANNDGQDESAGNITGKRCGKPTPTPTPVPTDTTPAPSPSESTPSDGGTTPPGEAPAPTPVKSNLPVTG